MCTLPKEGGVAEMEGMETKMDMQELREMTEHELFSKAVGE